MGPALDLKPSHLARGTSTDGAESNTRPAREKQGALMLSLSISRQDLHPVAMAGFTILKRAINYQTFQILQYDFWTFEESVLENSKFFSSCRLLPAKSNFGVSGLNQAMSSLRHLEEAERSASRS